MNESLDEKDQKLLAEITIASGEIVKGQGFLMLKKSLIKAKRECVLNELFRQESEKAERELRRHSERNKSP